MKKQILFLSISLYSIFILAQESYYDDVNLNLTGISLKEALATKIITTHTNNLSYTPGIWNAVMVTDMNPIDNSEVLLIMGLKTDQTLIAPMTVKEILMIIAHQIVVLVYGIESMYILPL